MVFDYRNAIQEKVLQRTSIRPTHPLAFACADRKSLGDFCVGLAVVDPFMPAPPSMARHSPCARMKLDLATVAVRVAGWPQWPLNRALSLAPVLVSRCSAQLQGLLRKMSKSLRDESESRADARAARAASMRCGQPGQCACFYAYALLWTTSNISVQDFACPLSCVAHPLMSIESLT